MLSYDTSVPAVVLKVGSYPNHHGPLAVARTLGRVGIPVYGVHEDRLTPAAVSRYTTGRLVWPAHDQTKYAAPLLAGLSEFAGRLGRPAVLVPTDDRAVLFVADHAGTLGEWFLFPQLSAPLARTVTDKAALRTATTDAPHAVVVTSPEQLAQLAHSATLPLVAKYTPVLLSDGRRTRATLVVRSREQLARLATPVLLQEYIADGEDWLFHGYCDATSTCALAFTGRKVRSFPTGAGETAYGRLTHNPELVEQARSLLRSLGYRGPVSMDYRLDPRDGRYKLLDLNPRLGAIFRLFTTTTGLDVVRAMHLDLTGRPFAAGVPVDGRVAVVENYDVRAAWELLREGAITLRAIGTSWREVDERAWLAADDPLPPMVAAARALVATTRSRGEALVRRMYGRA